MSYGDVSVTVGFVDVQVFQSFAAFVFAHLRSSIKTAVPFSIFALFLYSDFLKYGTTTAKVTSILQIR